MPYEEINKEKNDFLNLYYPEQNKTTTENNAILKNNPAEEKKLKRYSIKTTETLALIKIDPVYTDSLFLLPTNFTTNHNSKKFFTNIRNKDKNITIEIIKAYFNESMEFFKEFYGSINSIDKKTVNNFFNSITLTSMIYLINNPDSVKKILQKSFDIENTENINISNKIRAAITSNKINAKIKKLKTI